MSDRGKRVSTREAPEEERMREDLARTKNWKRWGPYLAERQWGTVREDYSADGESWHHFPHDHARSRAYRWGEDGLLGICDRQCRLCFGLSLWNERDPILKERLYGLTGPEGNHGEDVKEEYFYLDSTPTHSYMKALYKYPQVEYPYELLVGENARRGYQDREFELTDAGVFDENRYFDVFCEYAKGGPNDILIRVTAFNRGPEPAVLHILPTLWYRNTWSLERSGYDYWSKPQLSRKTSGRDSGSADGEWVVAEHESLGRYEWVVAEADFRAVPQLLFTENVTNTERLFGHPNAERYTKDAFHDYVISGLSDAIHPANVGTKAAAHFRFEVPAGRSVSLHSRLFAQDERPDDALGDTFGATFARRVAEAEEFYAAKIPEGLDSAENRVVRQAYGGLLWTKQFYHYTVREWLDGDPTHPAPPPERKQGRNSDWTHLYNRDIISMPDKWEYPWYAAWDLAFHMVPFARIDPQFAKEQLVLLLREWYMHPNGQMPAYEFNLSDVNPPVHAWAAWRVYKLTGSPGERDRNFLARVFHKLLVNFTWWINRKDHDGNHIFSGGFLGLDNIGVFDRSKPLPTGAHLEQADGTAWMAFYCGTMLAIALELSREDHSYADIASKFFEHYLAIANAINTFDGTGLWDEDDGFYYDHLHLENEKIPLRVRSMVGLLPLMTVEILPDEVIDELPGFQRRMQWFLDHQPDLARHISYKEGLGAGNTDGHHLLAIPSRERLLRMLHYLLDEEEFLSPFGIRSLSRVHKDDPYIFRIGTEEHRVGYVSGESDTYLFGGNSNWRGPIWFPLNFLIVEALERYHHFYGDDLKVECPVGSGQMLNLLEVATEITRRLSRLFVPSADSGCPCHGESDRFRSDEHWRDLLLFHEYFDGDDGRGLGASHQTGWTALVARCIEKLAARDRRVSPEATR